MTNVKLPTVRQVNIRIPVTLWLHCREIAERRGESMNTMIRSSLWDRVLADPNQSAIAFDSSKAAAHRRKAEREAFTSAAKEGMRRGTAT